MPMMQMLEVFGLPVRVVFDYKTKAQTEPTNLPRIYFACMGIFPMGMECNIGPELPPSIIQHIMQTITADLTANPVPDDIQAMLDKEMATIRAGNPLFALIMSDAPDSEVEEQVKRLQENPTGRFRAMDPIHMPPADQPLH